MSSPDSEADEYCHHDVREQQRWIACNLAKQEAKNVFVAASRRNKNQAQARNSLGACSENRTRQRQSRHRQTASQGTMQTRICAVAYVFERAFSQESELHADVARGLRFRDEPTVRHCSCGKIEASAISEQ